MRSISLPSLKIFFLKTMSQEITKKVLKKRKEVKPNPMFQGNMKNTYCLFQIKFITEYTNVQHIIITQI